MRDDGCVGDVAFVGVAWILAGDWIGKSMAEVDACVAKADL
jgi:hypothetical protein